jgi:2-dehydro-3-deoxygluconokinase
MANLFDLTTLGEAMLRLSVPLGRRLADTQSLDLQVGGAEANVAVALAQLGRRCAWLGRLPDHTLADPVLRSLRAAGVDTGGVVRAPGERIGTYFIEYASTPRSIQVIYDRADSAAARMTPADVDWDRLLDTRVLHLTGITAALGAGPYAVVAEAVKRARSSDVMLSFDVNHRAKLWSTDEASSKLRPLIAEADVLFCKGADAELLFGCEGEPEARVRALAKLTRASTVISTFGERGAVLLQGGVYSHAPALPVTIVDRIGSGDALAAGVLDGILDGDPPAGLRRGVALAAIALSQHGDQVLTSRAELAGVMAQQRVDVAR